VTTRKQSQVFGEVAQDYDAARSGYPVELVDAVLAFSGRRPRSAVEVGAGTGLATQAFADVFAHFQAPITCVEPDAGMAAVLAQRFAGDDLVDIVIGTFEAWTPPAAGVDLLYCAQAWHWVDPAVRFSLAYDALTPGGVLALFGHHHGFADEGMDAAMTAVYQEFAPSLVDVDEPARHTTVLYPELTDAALWADVTDWEFVQTVPTSTEDYLRLLTTFSGHRMLPEAQLTALLGGVRALVDGDGGVLRQRLATLMSLARKSPAG
jgi:SAM-dependent methyltransferase